MVLHQTYPNRLVCKHKPNPNPETKTQTFSSVANEQQKLETGSLQLLWVRKRKRRKNQGGLKERREMREDRGDGQLLSVRDTEERAREV